MIFSAGLGSGLKAAKALGKASRNVMRRKPGFRARLGRGRMAVTRQGIRAKKAWSGLSRTKKGLVGAAGLALGGGGAYAAGRRRRR